MKRLCKSTFYFGTVATAAVMLSACAHTPAGKGGGQLVDSLVTPTYYIDIRSANGLDGTELKFFVENRKTRASKLLPGQKKFAPCPSGEPHCENLIGYQFSDGDTHYFITESGRLTVTKDSRTILWERGDWEEEGGAGQ